MISCSSFPGPRVSAVRQLTVKLLRAKLLIILRVFSWYLSKGRVQDAYASLEQLRGKPLLAARDLYCKHCYPRCAVLTRLTVISRHTCTFGG